MRASIIHILKLFQLYWLFRRVYSCSRNVLRLPQAWLGAVRAAYGARLMKRSPTEFRVYVRACVRGRYNGYLLDTIIERVLHLEQSQQPLPVMTSIVSDIQNALRVGEFDRWASSNNTHQEKITLAVCENYLPGRKWKLQIFNFENGDAHPPHGHQGDLASCLVVYKGCIKAIEYDRLNEGIEGKICLKLAEEKELISGQYLITSRDYKNIHWFGAVGGRAVALNFHVKGYTGIGGAAPDLREYIDPLAYDANGEFSAPKLTVTEAYAKFKKRALVRSN